MLRADVVVAQAQCLAECELEHLLRARGERDLPGRHFLARADDAHDLRAHALHSDVEGLEDTSRKSLLLAQQAEQDVLGADVVVLERSRFLLRENDDLAGSFCESLEHVLLVLPAVRVEASASVDAWSLGRVGGTGYRPTTHLFGRNRLEDESIGCCWQAMSQSTNVPAGPCAMAEGFPQSARTTPSGCPHGPPSAARTTASSRPCSRRSSALRPSLPRMASSRRASTRGWPRSPIGKLAVAEPHRDGAAVAQRPLEIEALGRVDEVAQRLVAQARGVEAADLDGLGIGGEREQEMRGRHAPVAEPLGLPRRILEHALGGLGEGQPGVLARPRRGRAGPGRRRRSAAPAGAACGPRRGAGGPCRSAPLRSARASSRAMTSAWRAPRPCSPRTPARAYRPAGSAARRAGPRRPAPATGPSGRRRGRRRAVPCGVCAACSRAHGSGVERSRSPASSSVGTGGRSPVRGAGGAGVGGQRRHSCA